MDGGEIEMSREELQSWIRDKMKKTELVSSDTLEKCTKLQSLLQRREEQAANLLKLCESVAACEETVKKLYSLLGWEYDDTDYDDDDIDDNQASSGQASPPSCESVYSETQVPRPSSATSAGPAKSKDSKTQGRNLRRKYPDSLMREAVVVLTKLPASDTTSIPPSSSPENHRTENELSSSAESDMQWEPGRDSSDSDCSVSSTWLQKKKKRRKTKEKRTKSHTTRRGSKNGITNGSGAKRVTLKRLCRSESEAAKTSVPQVSSTTEAKNKGAKSRQADKVAGSRATKTSTSTAATVTQSSASKTARAETQEEIKVNMKVLARRRPLNWQRGTVVEIITKEDGRVKYKVNFEEKGKSLVSGYHIAFDCMPKVNELFIGTRVVIKTEGGQFMPGVMAEVPSRRNRMRFLVFIDDHTSMYVALPVIHVVCKQLKDPLDDILDEKHKHFMQIYLKRWPFPPQAQFRVGQTVNIEYNGVMERTNVLEIDCSLMQVVFLNDNRKEWIYRGSNRLEQMAYLNETPASKGELEEK